MITIEGKTDLLDRIDRESDPTTCGYRTIDIKSINESFHLNDPMRLPDPPTGEALADLISQHRNALRQSNLHLEEE
jgi:hypothetical protein